MSETIPGQHPAVVLRSHYRHLRALLVIAMVAVVGLSAAVVILASDDAGRARGATPVSPASSRPAVRSTSTRPARATDVRHEPGGGRLP